jgi:hypothetical protein
MFVCNNGIWFWELSVDAQQEVRDIVAIVGFNI